MNTNTIKEGSSFNFEAIRYASVKTNSLGGKNVKILDAETNEWLIISTPLMLSFGISDYVDPNTGVGNGKYELSQLFPNTEYATEETKMFLENIKNFENKIKHDALKNSKEWFGKVHKSAEVVEALWTPMLKYSKNKDSGEYNLEKPPYIRSKVPFYENKWKCEVYSEDGELLFPNDENANITPLDLFPSKKKCNIATVLVCGGIWFTNGKFTVTWELAQVITQKPRERVLGQRKCLINLKPAEQETLKNQSFEENNVEDVEEETNIITSTSSRKTENNVEDSDNEEDVVDEAPKAQVFVAEEAQTLDKKKKIVKKKN